ncbi:FG-GAP repeat domain-containing protein [Elusimicrobiota bacterium]
MEWGDFDSDGDLDLAAGKNAFANRVSRNNGDGTFPTMWSSSSVEDDSWSVRGGDFDNDGDLDMVVGNNGINEVYRNDGAAAFVLAWNSVEAQNTQSVSWGDFDNDGDLDYAAGNYQSTDRVFRPNLPARP